jgi:membrane protease subunit (stomatin/prohibitin family)
MAKGLMPGAVDAQAGVGVAIAPAATASAGGGDAAARLAQLKGLLDQGLIMQADYDTAKAEILKKLIG